MSEFPPGSLALQEKGGMVFRNEFPKVQLDDVTTLSCRFQDRQPNMLHACAMPKPWQLTGAQRDVYLDMLRYVVSSSSLPIRIPATLCPLWMWDNPLGDIAYRALSRMNERERLSRALNLPSA